MRGEGGAVVEVGLARSTKGMFALVQSSKRIVYFISSSAAESCSSVLEDMEDVHREGMVWTVPR